MPDHFRLRIDRYSLGIDQPQSGRRKPEKRPRRRSVFERRRLGREGLVLGLRGQRAEGLGVIDRLRQQLEAERRQRTLPQLAGGLALFDEAPVLHHDRAGIHAVGEVIDRAARDRIAFADGPFHRGNAAMARQERRVITDAAEFRGGKCLAADAGVAVGGDDQIGRGRDFRGGHDLRIGLHGDLDIRLAGRGRQAIIAIVHHDARDAKTVLMQHVENDHAEMAGADERDPHSLPTPEPCCVRISNSLAPSY